MEPTQNTDLSHGFGRAFLGMMPRTTVCGGWTSYAVQPDSDEVQPPFSFSSTLRATAPASTRRLSNNVHARCP